MELNQSLPLPSNIKPEQFPIFKSTKSMPNRQELKYENTSFTNSQRKLFQEYYNYYWS